MEETYSKNKAIVGLIFRIFGFLIGVTAITLQILTSANVSKTFMGNHVMAYYTVQTNIFTTLVFLYLIINTIVKSVKEHKLVLGKCHPIIHLGTTFCITVTMMGYWLALAPMLGLPSDPLLVSNNLFLHLFTPLMAIFDCVFFLKHNQLKIKDSFWWLIYPSTYLVSVLIIGAVTDVPYYTMVINGEKIPLMYPYPFLEPKIVGVGGMIGIICALITFFILFGLLYVFIDQQIGKYQQKRASKVTNE